MTQSPNCIPPYNPSYIITCTFTLIAAWVISYCTCFTPQINHLVISIRVDQSVTGTFTLPINIFMTFQSLIHFITLNFQVFFMTKETLNIWNTVWLVCFPFQASAWSRCISLWEQKAHLNTSGWMGDSNRKMTTSSGKNRKAINVSNVTRNTFPL